MKKVLQFLIHTISALFFSVGMGTMVFLLMFYFLPFSLEGIGDIKYVNGGKSVFYDTYYNIQIIRYQDDVRELAVDLVRGCKSNQYCCLDRVFNYLSEFDYIYSQSKARVNPLEAIKTKSFDCKEAAVLTCSLLRAVMVTCYPSSNIEIGHAIAVVEIENSIIVVDLTLSEYWYVENVTNIWDKYNEWGETDG